jgi:hypothetical protein
VQAEGDDPLDAFMAEMQQMVDNQKEEPQDKNKKERVDLDEEEDHVADFLEVRCFSILRRFET